MTYKEWGEAIDLWQHFLAAFRNMGDEQSVLTLLGDGLEEAGFPEVANQVRERVAGGGRRHNGPMAYWAGVADELQQHGMVVADDELRMADGTRLKLTHSQLLVNNRGRWVPLKKPMPEAVPGLACLLVHKIQYTSETHSNRIAFSFLGRYSVELLKAAERLRELVYTGEDGPPMLQLIKRAEASAAKAADIIQKIQKGGVDRDGREPFRHMLANIEHYVEQFGREMENMGMPHSRQFDDLMGIIQAAVDSLNRPR